MKIKIIVASFFAILFSEITTSEKTTSTTLLQELSKESWVLSVCVSPFKKSTLEITDSTNTTKQKFPLCSQEDAITIESFLSSSFRGLPSGYQNCLHEILTGNDTEERLIFTPEHVIIQDREQKNLQYKNPRVNTTQSQ